MIPTQHDLKPCPYGCRQNVLMTQTERGFRLAVNPVPDPAGNTAVTRDGPGTWRSRSLGGHDAMPPLAYEHTFMPHVATSRSCRPASSPASPLATRAVLAERSS